MNTVVFHSDELMVIVKALVRAQTQEQFGSNEKSDKDYRLICSMEDQLEQQREAIEQKDLRIEHLQFKVEQLEYRLSTVPQYGQDFHTELDARNQLIAQQDTRINQLENIVTETDLEIRKLKNAGKSTTLNDVFTKLCVSKPEQARTILEILAPASNVTAPASNVTKVKIVRDLTGVRLRAAKLFVCDDAPLDLSDSVSNPFDS